MSSFHKVACNVLHWRSTGIRCWSCPVAMIKRKMIIKLPKSFLERVQPQTKADSELQPKLVCPAPYFANALLAAVLLPGLFLLKALF